MMKERLTIAMDGPAGSGKSTIAQRLAEKFGLSLSEFRLDVPRADAFIPPRRRRSDECAYVN